MRFLKRSETAALAVSLLLGFAGTCLYAEHARFPEPLHTEYSAWWGGLYPQYCFPGAMEAVSPYEDRAQDTGDAAAGGQTRDERVEIRLKYLTFLNKEKLEE